LRSYQEGKFIWLYGTVETRILLPHAPRSGVGYGVCGAREPGRVLPKFCKQLACVHENILSSEARLSKLGLSKENHDKSPRVNVRSAVEGHPLPLEFRCHSIVVQFMYYRNQTVIALFESFFLQCTFTASFHDPCSCSLILELFPIRYQILALIPRLFHVALARTSRQCPDRTTARSSASVGRLLSEFRLSL
jgi:hypothetical protein